MNIRIGLLMALVVERLPVCSDRPQHPRQRPWRAELERELQQKGVQIDPRPSSRPRSRIQMKGLVGPRWSCSGVGAKLSPKRLCGKIMVNDASRLVRETAALALVRLGHREVLSDVKELMATTGDPSARSIWPANWPSSASSAVFLMWHVPPCRMTSTCGLERRCPRPLRNIRVRGSRGAMSPRELLTRLLPGYASPKIRSEALLEISWAREEDFR